MRHLALHTLVVLLAGSAACCTPPKPLPSASGPTVYVCVWTDIEMSQGVSVVTGGNPKDKPTEDLAKKGLSYKVKHERVMECQAVEPPVELRDKLPPPNVISSPPRKKQPNGPGVLYINNYGEEI